jgi:hypothetical protein
MAALVRVRLAASNGHEGGTEGEQNERNRNGRPVTIRKISESHETESEQEGTRDSGEDAIDRIGCTSPLHRSLFGRLGVSLEALGAPSHTLITPGNP